MPQLDEMLRLLTISRYSYMLIGSSTLVQIEKDLFAKMASSMNDHRPRRYLFCCSNHHVLINRINPSINTGTGLGLKTKIRP
jgi:hypothetical protein